MKSLKRSGGLQLYWGVDDALDKAHALGVRDPGSSTVTHQCVPEQDASPLVDPLTYIAIVRRFG